MHNIMQDLNNVVFKHQHGNNMSTINTSLIVDEREKRTVADWLNGPASLHPKRNRSMFMFHAKNTYKQALP